MRHTAQTEPDAGFETGALRIDFVRRLVTVGGEEVRLTTTEYSLLQTFAQHAGKVLTHTHLLQMVWGQGYENEAHILRVNISNLRRKLEPNPLQPQYLITEPGVGYRLRLAEPARWP
jgi:two-component system KDP operon response regulator KdpE